MKTSTQEKPFNTMYSRDKIHNFISSSQYVFNDYKRKSNYEDSHDYFRDCYVEIGDKPFSDLELNVIYRILKYKLCWRSIVKWPKYYYKNIAETLKKSGYKGYYKKCERLYNSTRLRKSF